MYGRRSIQHTREPTVGHSLIDLSAEETDEYLISLDLPVLMEDRQAQVSYHSFVNPTQGPEVQAEVQQPGGGSSEGRESSRTPITQLSRFRGRGRGRETPRVWYTAEDWDRISRPLRKDIVDQRSTVTSTPRVLTDRRGRVDNKSPKRAQNQLGGPGHLQVVPDQQPVHRTWRVLSRFGCHRKEAGI